MKGVCISILAIMCCVVSFGQSFSLNHFVEQAKNNSPLLKDYQYQILSNRLDSAIFRAALKTQVHFINSNSYAPVIKGYGYDEAISNIANVLAVVQASRNFVNRNNTAAQLMTIALQGRALTDTIRLTEQDISRTITEQYITAYGDQATMEYNKEIFDLLQKEETILKKLTQQNVFKQTDYLNFYVTMQQQELAYLQAQIQYNADFATLNYMAGIEDTTVGIMEEPVLNDSFHMDFYSSIFYHRFVTDSLRIANQKALISYEYKPRVGAYSDAGYSSSLQNTPYKNFGISVGLSVTVPIYDGHQKKMKNEKIELQERTRQSNKQFFINQYLQQAAMLKRQLLATGTLVRKIKQQINYAHTLIVANGKLLQTGDITMKDFILSINNYLNARNMLIQNNVSRLRILNQVNYWNR